MTLALLKAMANMIVHSKIWFPFFPAILAIVASGCGQKELSVPDLHPVRGTLTIRGEPARYVGITFEPQGGYGLQAEGLTSHDGTFELRTLSNDGLPDGAAAGEYEVVLDTGGTPEDAPEGAVATQVGMEFHTGIIVKVEKGDNDLDIDVP